LIINLDHFFGSIGILCRQIIGIITKIAIYYGTGDFYFTVVGLLFCLVVRKKSGINSNVSSAAWNMSAYCASKLE